MRNTKFKLFKDTSLKHLHDDLNICGAVRNHFIAVSMRYYRRFGKGLSYSKMSAHLTKLKKLEKNQHWNIPYSWSLQNVVKRLARAFRDMKTLGRGHPQFKSCKKHRGMTFSGEHVRIVKLLEKQKHFRNQERARKTIARLHKKTAHQRADHHWKLAITLCKTFDILFFEALCLSGMKALWGKQVSDLAFGEFIQKLKHQAMKRNRFVFKIGRWTPTTKCCAVCNHKNETLTLADRHWTCPKCHTHLDRDPNAAMNILKEGVASFGLGCVSPIVLFHKIVGCAALATSPLLKSTNASAEKTAEAPMLSQGVYHNLQCPVL